MNTNQKLRDSITFGGTAKYSGGIARFVSLNIEQLNKLNDLGFVDLEDTQNDSPRICEFMGFMIKHPQVKAHGYVVSIEREDYRISIEGLGCKENITNELRDEFIDLFRLADEFAANNKCLYCWWD